MKSMVILCHCNQNFKDPFMKKQSKKRGQMPNVLYTVQWDPVYMHYFLTQTHRYANNKLKNGENGGLVCICSDGYLKRSDMRLRELKTFSTAKAL